MLSQRSSASCREAMIRLLSVAGVCACLGFPAAAPAFAAPAPEAAAPLVLQFLDAPIFLAPHTNSVTSVAFSPDGRTLATGANDGALRLWDTATGKLTSIHAEDATRGIDSIAWSPDGRLVAVVGTLLAKEAVLWDTVTGRMARELGAGAASAGGAATAAGAVPMVYKGMPVSLRAFRAVAFSPDGRILAEAGNGVVLRDVDSGNVIAVMKQPASGVAAIAFFPDGKTLAAASSDRKVRLWSVPGGTLEATLDGPTQPLSTIAVSSDGRRVLAGSGGAASIIDRTGVGSLWLWDQPRGRARRIDTGKGAVRQVVFVSPSSAVVAAGKNVLSVDLQAGSSRSLRTIWTQTEEVLALASAPGGRILASGGADRAVDIVDSAAGTLVHRLPGLTDIVSSVAASGDGRFFAAATIDRRFSNLLQTGDESFAARYAAYFSGGSDAGMPQPGAVWIFSTKDGRVQSSLPLSTSQVTSIVFIPGSHEIAVAGWSPGKGGSLSVWDPIESTLIRDFSGHEAEVLSVAASPDGSTLAGADGAGKVVLWDLATGDRKLSLAVGARVEAVVFSPDGKLLAAADASRMVRLFEVASGRNVRSMRSRSYVESLAFSPDSALLAAGTRDPETELWDLRSASASRPLTLKAAGDYFGSMPGFVAFSSDGRFVVCAGHGKDIAVFDAATATLRLELRGHFHAPTAAAFLPDGRLVSGGEERTVRLWSVDPGTLLATWVAVPADARQEWDDEWVGYRPSGEFAGSARLDRLVGWISGGEVFGPEEDGHQRLVDTLFQAR